MVVGVNRFVEDDAAPEMPQPDFGVLAEHQRQQLRDVRGRREEVTVSEALAALRGAAAQDTAPLMPLIIEAVRARATLGEISDVFRDTWGVYRPG